MKKYICPQCESRNIKPYCNECDKPIPSNRFIEIENETKFSHISISDERNSPNVRCPSCDKPINSHKSTCPYCGELLLKGTKYPTSFNAREQARKEAESKQKELENKYTEAYGVLWGEVVIGGAVLYLIIHLLVKALF